MSQSDKPLPPTPRTDEVAVDQLPQETPWMAYDQMMNHARQLERELAESKKMHGEAISNWVEWEARANRVIKERDRLGRELAEMTESREEWKLTAMNNYSARSSTDAPSDLIQAVLSAIRAIPLDSVSDIEKAVAKMDKTSVAVYFMRRGINKVESVFLEAVASHQSAIVSSLTKAVGNVLDHWEGVPNDLKDAIRDAGEGFEQAMDALEDAQSNTPLPET